MTLPSLTLPPVIERELRVGARRPGLYWARVGAAATGLVIAALFFWNPTAAPAMTGRTAFQVLAFFAAWAAVGSVVALAAGAFAREKREDTLGLLFLTPLRPVHIATGKLISTSLAAFYRFLAIVPALALPMLVGGVAWRDFLLLVLALANVTFLGATLGLYVSAVNWDEKRATTFATLALFAILGGAPFLLLIATLSSNVPPDASIFAISPAYSIWHAMAGHPWNAGALWTSLAITHGLAWAFFVATCRVLPTCWQRHPESNAPAGEHLQPAPTPPAGSAAGPAAAPPVITTPAAPGPAPGPVRVGRSVRRAISDEERERMLERNPFLWFASRWHTNSTGAWLLGIVLFLTLLPALTVGDGEVLLMPAFAIYVAFSVNAVIKIYVTTQAASALARDRGENALELLLSTPATPGTVIEGHLLALRESVWPWLRVVMGAEVLWLAAAILGNLDDTTETFLAILAALGVVGFLLPDLDTLRWTALWQGVVAKNSQEAEKEAFLRVMLLPWIAAIGVWLLFLGPMQGGAGLLGLIIAYVFLSALADYWFTRRSREQLESALTLWAQRRSAGEFEHYDGWRHLGRRLGRWWALRQRR